MTPDRPLEVLSLLLGIRAEQRAQRELLVEVLGELRALNPPPAGYSLFLAERTRLEALLPVLELAGTDTAWTVGELLANIDVDAALSGAIETATGPIDKSTPLRLGRLLGRAVGRSVAGYRVERGKMSREGVTIWAVRRGD